MKVLGLLLLLGSIALGYLMHGGHLNVLLQVSELIILSGAAVSFVLISAGPRLMRQMMQRIFPARTRRYDRETYVELLRALAGLLWIAAGEGGIRGLEAHVERPLESPFFRDFPRLRADVGALMFLADTMKLITARRMDETSLAELLDSDLEQHLEGDSAVPDLLNKIADAMPAFGILAAVLGVIISMGHIGGDPAEVGGSIAAALVGTFLGVLLAYGVLNPIGHALEAQARARQSYLRCIRAALLSYARGEPPSLSIEHARRSIEPSLRPTFDETEALVANGRRNRARAA